jgi:hypothetical protein
MESYLLFFFVCLISFDIIILIFIHVYVSISRAKRVQIFKYLHMHNKISWGWHSSLNMKSINISYTLYTCNLVSLYTVFSVPVF